jgi:hypothetical protein
MQNRGMPKHQKPPATLPADLHSAVRVITTKHKTYSLPLSVPGIPVEDQRP